MTMAETNTKTDVEVFYLHRDDGKTFVTHWHGRLLDDLDLDLGELPFGLRVIIEGPEHEDADHSTSEDVEFVLTELGKHGIRHVAEILASYGDRTVPLVAIQVHRWFETEEIAWYKFSYQAGMEGGGGGGFYLREAECTECHPELCEEVE